MPELKYEVVRKIAELSSSPSGWKCELNLIKWGDGEPVYDVRDWSPDHKKMGKGKTLTREQASALARALNLELCRKDVCMKSGVFGE